MRYLFLWMLLYPTLATLDYQLILLIVLVVWVLQLTGTLLVRRKPPIGLKILVSLCPQWITLRDSPLSVKKLLSKSSPVSNSEMKCSGEESSGQKMLDSDTRLIQK